MSEQIVESPYIEHRGGSTMLARYIGHEGGRGLFDVGMAGVYEAWLFSEGKHRAGQFVSSGMYWWSVPGVVLRKIRGDAPTLRHWLSPPGCNDCGAEMAQSGGRRERRRRCGRCGILVCGACFRTKHGALEGEV